MVAATPPSQNGYGCFFSGAGGGVTSATLASGCVADISAVFCFLLVVLVVPLNERGCSVALALAQAV